MRDESSTLARQLLAFRSGRAFFEPRSECVLARGADHRRFLNGLVTCDLATLEAGDLRYGFSTDVKGRILSDFHALTLPDSLYLVWPEGRSEAMIEHLTRYRIADRVEFEVLSDSCLVLAANRAEDLPIEAVPNEGHGLETEGLGRSVRVVRRRVAGLDALVLFVDRADHSAWRAALEDRGLSAIREEAWNCHHVEAGHPRYGIDFAEDCFPQETGLEAAAVSYEKGCYLGQEVIARIHYRGGVQRMLCGLQSLPTPLPPAGSPITFEGRAVGRLGASALSPTCGPIGLAILHQRASALGTEVEIEGGTAEIAKQPFEALPSSE